MKGKKRIYKILGMFLVSMVISSMSISSIYGKNIMKKPVSITGEEKRTDKKDEKKTGGKLEKSEKKTKKVFLTFDDGPSINNTRNILKILKDNNVKATFFVIGCKAEEYSDIIKELKEAGMSIQSHTYSHDYKIYKSVDKYMDDLQKCKETIEKLTGQKTGPYVRIPGGSDNLVAKKYILKNIREEIKEKGMYYVDWNVSCGDAAGYNIPEYKIENNVKKQCENKDLAVVLMHDSYYKKTTVQALPKIIKNLKDEGFVFRTFNDLTDSERENMIDDNIINRDRKKKRR